MSKVKCLKCGEILESKHRHDFVMCSCDNQSFVDGGSDYIRVGGKDLGLIALYNSVKDEWTLSYGIRGGVNDFRRNFYKW